MKVSQLQYAVQKEYTIPYLPHVFYVVILLLLGILIPVNVALVGLDVVTTLKDDPTAVDNPWGIPRSWSSFLRPYTAQKCQPASITDDINLRTNSSMPIFKYTLQRAYSNKKIYDDPTNRIYPAPYLANKLSNCEIRSITWRVEIPAIVMRYQAKIYCTLERDKSSDEIPDEMVFIMTYSRSGSTDLAPDDMIDHLASTVVPESRGHSYSDRPTLGNLPTDPSSTNNVLAVLDGMYYDLQSAIWTQVYIWENMEETEWLDIYIVEWTAREGDYCRVNSTCGSMTNDIRWRRWYGIPNDYGRNVTFIMPFNITITNSLIALRDAIMIDLGNAQASSNMYLNKTYFDEVIRIDPYHAEGASILGNRTGDLRMNSTEYWKFCNSWVCVNTSLAEAFMKITDDTPLKNIALPYRPKDTQVPSVLSFRYLCPTFQRKRTSALLVSVFVTTVTIMSTLYALFDLYMPKVEAHYQKRKQAFARAINRNMDEQADDEHYLVGRPMARVNTFDSSNTLYDPVPQIEKDKERYD
ncbi:hypothetical protein RSOLAG22IIIB_01856 [Rhizoctonia solani]|uniref:Uncharacterized protein n=1 Tax=Rhizoctonia solani TaxID=456999 RepID=A0A0K6GBI5_9AGAM|nr:hypothetical protein RSOLAG22IIIB_01856 [Rhizoctonia solani]